MNDEEPQWMSWDDWLREFGPLEGIQRWPDRWRVIESPPDDDGLPPS
jgi:hypothetical protein